MENKDVAAIEGDHAHGKLFHMVWNNEWKLYVGRPASYTSMQEVEQNNTYIFCEVQS